MRIKYSQILESNVGRDCISTSGKRSKNIFKELDLGRHYNPWWGRALVTGISRKWWPLKRGEHSWCLVQSRKLVESNHIKSWRQEPVDFSGYVSGCHTNGLKVQPGLSPKTSLQETQASLVDGENREEAPWTHPGLRLVYLAYFDHNQLKSQTRQSLWLTKSGERLSSGVVLQSEGLNFSQYSDQLFLPGCTFVKSCDFLITVRVVCLLTPRFTIYSW